METISTRERILQIALDLFSVRGYRGVSIRDLAKIAGIKESSIYYHFTNKQSIMDELIQRVGNVMGQMSQSFQLKLYKNGKISQNDFLVAAEGYMEYFFLDSFIFKMIQILTIEKNDNEVAKQAYDNMLFQIPLDHQQKVFTYLFQQNLIYDGEAEALAMEYQSILLSIFFKYFSGLEDRSSQKEKAKMELKMLMTRFYQRIFKEMID